MMSKLLSIFTDSEQSFHGQEPHERVLMTLRRHPFTLSYPLILIFLAAFVPMLGKLAFGAEIRAEGLEALFLFLSSLWYGFLWLAAFYFLTMYALNTVIITDRRIIENEQHGFFNRRVAELHLYRVQDVSVHTAGVIETLLSFGNVTVQTAASEREFTFDRIPHPEKVKDAIMKWVSTHREHLKL